MSTCPKCNQPVQAGERRVSWFEENSYGLVNERGSAHLVCPVHGVTASARVGYPTAEGYYVSASVWADEGADTILYALFAEGGPWHSDIIGGWRPVEGDLPPDLVRLVPEGGQS